MAKRKRKQSKDIKDYRHESSTRKNNPPAGIAPSYEISGNERISYDYDPHLDPQLMWASKQNGTSFDVESVSLHIHERVSTRAILDGIRKPVPIQLTLFGDDTLPADQQIEFYQHDIGWANRLILGDSLLVMNSLLSKEGMTEKVQMIFMDPPYGISYSSNFQPRSDKRDVEDKDSDLTREPEQIKAYRDTWKLGIHSYLSYLRDRLLLSRELLDATGSCFIQMGYENVHLVRCLLDEVFGKENFIAEIAFRKTSVKRSSFLPSTHDYLLWYAKDKSQTKYRQLYTLKTPGEEGSKWYDHILD